MFPYRPALLNNRARLLLAVFLAGASHIGLMTWEFSGRPVFVPLVSLPQSVNIFLERNDAAGIPAGPPVAAEPGPETEAVFSAPEPQTLAPTLEKIPAAEEKISEPEQPQVTAPEIPGKIAAPAETANAPSEAGAESSIPAPEKSAAEPGSAADAAVWKALPQRISQDAGKAGTAETSSVIRTAYPHYKLNTPPLYPGLAQKRGQEGTVILQVLVNREGRVDDLEIETSSGFASLDRSAAAAVRKWQFEPGRQGEKKIAMRVRVPVVFTLTN